jgi:hypothetical protein
MHSCAVARFYRDAKLPRGVRPSGHTRLRWQAEHPGVLWHLDVCHGPALRIGKTTKPLRIHALLDDASRYVVALEAHHTEREDDVVDLMLGALRRCGAAELPFGTWRQPGRRGPRARDRRGRHLWGGELAGRRTTHGASDGGPIELGDCRVAGQGGGDRARCGVR